MPVFTLPTGILTFDLPTATRLVEEAGPTVGRIEFGPEQEIYYSLTMVDLAGAEDVAADALHMALDDGETIAAVPTDRGALFADVLTIDVERGPIARTGSYFLRLDLLPTAVLRILKIAPGRLDGESAAERAEMDALGLEVASAARFAPDPTGLDRAAPKPGTVMLQIPDRIHCSLPPGWSVHDPSEFEDDWEPDEDCIEVVCVGPDDAVSMYVSAMSMSCEPPLSAEELAEDYAEMRREDIEDVRALDAMGDGVESIELGPTRHLVRGGFEPSALGVEGRHYRLRAASAGRMVVVEMTPVLTDPAAGPADARSILDPLENHIRRAHLFAE